MMLLSNQNFNDIVANSWKIRNQQNDRHGKICCFSNLVDAIVYAIWLE